LNYIIGDRIVLKEQEGVLIGKRKTKLRVDIGEAIVVWNNPMVPMIGIIFEHNTTTLGPVFRHREDIERVLGHLSLDELLTHHNEAVREAGLKLIENKGLSYAP